MVQKSGEHQLRLVVYPILYKVLYIPGGDRRISSINSRGCEHCRVQCLKPSKSRTERYVFFHVYADSVGSRSISGILSRRRGPGLLGCCLVVCSVCLRQVRIIPIPLVLCFQSRNSPSNSLRARSSDVFLKNQHQPFVKESNNVNY